VVSNIGALGAFKMVLKKGLVSISFVTDGVCKQLECSIKEAMNIVLKAFLNYQEIEVFTENTDGLLTIIKDSSVREVKLNEYFVKVPSEKVYKDSISLNQIHKCDLFVRIMDGNFIQIQTLINFSDIDLLSIQNKKNYSPKIYEKYINDKSRIYETDLLNIQKLAIKEFFYPRKRIDPKKEEVTEWLKNKGDELKINVSDNIADTIFTIIKPADHNPKKRRVEP